MRKLILLFILVTVITGIAAAQQHGTGVILNDSAYKVPRPHLRKSVWHYTYKPVVSFKEYTPVPQDQQQCQSCVGWACAYAGLTTMWAKSKGITNQALITENAYNPMYLYFSIAKTCDEGMDIFKAMDLMETNGIVLNKYVSGPINGPIPVPANKRFKILYYNRIFEFHSDSDAVVKATRTCLNDGSPVLMIGLIDKDLYKLNKENYTWVPKTVKEDTPVYHAMCVIGYNDSLKRFEIMNSWGTQWGNDGYFYISYKDFARMAVYAFQIEPGFDAQAETNIIDIAGDVKIEKSITPGGAKFMEVKPALAGTYYELDNEIKKGDTYRFQLIDLKKDRYTYVIGIGPDKQARIVYSSDDPALSDKIAALTSAHNNVTITPFSSNNSVKAKKGTYQYCVLYAVNPIKNIDEVLKQVNQEKDDHIEDINNILGARFITKNTIDYRSGSIKAKGIMAKGDIIPVYFKINVKN